MAKKKGLKKIIEEKINFLDAIPDEFINQTVRGAQAPLFDNIVSLFVDQLETDGDRILASLYNFRLISVIDNIWSKFQAKQGLSIVQNQLSNYSQIVNNNVSYYSDIIEKNKEFITKAQNVTSIVNRRLGINPDGTLIKAGYLGGILEDVSVRNQVKEFAIRSVANSTGFDAMKKELGEFVRGTEGKFGVLEKYYRNVAYDSFKQLDGLHNKLIGEEFKLKYFVYDGTLIKTSRLFCKKRVGLIFTREQAEEWKTDPDLTAAPLNYDPLVDMGGYACRHTPRFITDEMAYTLEPSLKPAN